MSFIVAQRDHHQVPSIDWSNPITRGLEFFAVPDVRQCLVTGSRLDRESVAAPPGRGRMALPEYRGWLESPRVTLATAVMMTRSVAGQFSSVLGLQYFVSNADRQGLIIQQDSTLGRFGVYARSNDGFFNTTFSGVPTTSLWQSFALTCNGTASGSPVVVYRNGNQETTTTLLASRTADTRKRLTFGSSTYYPAYYGMAWSRVLTLAEISRLNADPWCLLSNNDKDLSNVASSLLLARRRAS